MVTRLFDFYKVFHECLKTFPKQEKYSSGNVIEKIIIETLDVSLRASYLTRDKKRGYVEEISYKIDLLKYLVRLAHETKSINIKKYLLLEGRLIEMGKMCGGWLKTL